MIRAILNLILGKPDPYWTAQARFDARIAEARARHAATRDIEAERRAFVNDALAGGRG